MLVSSCTCLVLLPMEQNKHAAIHAEEMAEKRLLKKDYAGAKAMALKAKKLFPLDNLSQLLAVCEVHCSAQLMANGMYDWYKIIQVDPLSEEIMIKKQYHKLVALLHPDKNKIPGAEEAFKLVVEANNTLSDRAKRIMYDLKRKHLVRSAGPHESTETNAAHNSSSNFNRANKWKPQQQSQPQPHQLFTFWTACPGCETRHQYNRNILSHIVCCTHCSKNFIANALPHLNAGHIDGGQSPQQITETNAAHNSSSNLNRANKWRPQQQPQPQPQQPPRFTFWTECPGCEYRHQYHRNVLSHKVCCMHCSKNFVANALPHLNIGHIDGGRSPQQITETSSAHDSSGNLNSANKCWAQQQPQPQPHLGVTFRTECPSCGTLLQYYSNILHQIVYCTHCSKSFSASAASHLKEQVEPSGSAEDNGATSKKARVEVNRVPNGNGSANATNTNTSASTCVEGEMREQDTEKEKGIEQLKPCGFLKEKDTAFKPSASAEGSRAIYKKTKVEVNGVPDGNGSANATNTNTNASSRAKGEVKEQDGGKEKENKKEKEQVEPSGLLEKGNTDFKQCGSTEDNCATSKKANLEVEGVQDSNGSAETANTSASIILERKVKEQDRGTARTFIDNALPHLNPGNQPQQFTGQQQPQQSDSYRFTYVQRVRGTTRNNAGEVRKPNGNCLSMCKSKNPNAINEQRAKSFSADTSQMPYPCSEPDLSLDIYQRGGNADGTGGGNHASGTSRPQRRFSRNKPDVKYKGTGVSNPAKKARGEVKGERNGNSPGTSKRLRRSLRYKPDVKSNGTCVSSPDKKSNDDAEKLYVYPDPEFHKFDMCRACNKFQQGNIWALYSDLDTFPKYYGLICTVEYEPFQVHVNWLKACPKSDVERAWLDVNLPISCGKFRVTTQNMTYDKPDYFSHMVSVRHHDRGNFYEILPEVGEVWALYKNWSVGWTPRDFKTCKFDIVEVLENREQSTIVCPLRQVPEYTSVFMLDEVDGTGSGAWEVPASVYILFSHKIPAIRLKDECGGKLEGFWELDPASVP